MSRGKENGVVIDTDKGFERLSVEVAAKKYLGLLVKISKDLGLPYHAEVSRLKSIGFVSDFDCPGVDPFIGRYAEEYKSENYRIRDVAWILDAKATIDNLTSGMEDGKLLENELIISGRRLKNTEDALDRGLRMVYSAVNGKRNNETFEDLFDRFFYGNSETEADIELAIKLRAKYFDKNNDLNNRIHLIPDRHFGYLADQVAA